MFSQVEVDQPSHRFATKKKETKLGVSQLRFASQLDSSCPTQLSSQLERAGSLPSSRADRSVPTSGLIMAVGIMAVCPDDLVGTFGWISASRKKNKEERHPPCL